MNRVILIGRLTKDPDVRYTSNQDATAVARYTLACDRAYKKKGEQTADFINCVSFGKNAEFAEKYLKKGMKIAIEGRWQTGNVLDLGANLTRISISRPEITKTGTETRFTQTIALWSVRNLQRTRTKMRSRAAGRNRNRM